MGGMNPNLGTIWILKGAEVKTYNIGCGKVGFLRFYEVSDVGLGSNVLDGQLSDQSPLMVVEDKLVLRDDVDKVRTDVEARPKQVRVSFEILLA
jgi:hypothetical protein